MLTYYKKWHWDVRHHQTRSRKILNDMIVAVEAAKQGVTVGEDTVSGWTFADDFVGISEPPEGLQNETRRHLFVPQNPPETVCEPLTARQGKVADAILVKHKNDYAW